MSVDLKSVTPQPSDWFSANVSYEGRGRAEFIDPVGVIEGLVKVSYDEFGSYSIRMDVEAVEGNQPLPVGPIQLSNDAVPNSVSVGLDYNQPYNTCSRLTVTTLEGTFSANAPITYRVEYVCSRTDGAQSWLNFSPGESQFDTNEGATAKFWVLPLSNFLSDFMQKHPSLDRHPLRIYPTPIVPNGSDEKNRLIIFNVDGSLGFIERLPDYEQREDALLGARNQHLVTSVMVGEVGSTPIDMIDLDKWLPLDLLHLLGLATGTEVWNLWIEFRDQEGKLVRRLHHNYRPPVFSEGHVAIDGVINRGTGLLLTKYSTSTYCGKSFLRAVMRNIIRGGSHNLSVEQRMSYLCRALDTLCDEYKLKKALSPKETLSDEYKSSVDQIIRSASNSISSIIRQAESENRNTDANTLRRIKQKVCDARNIPIGFGKAVVLLLEKFDLPDAEILAEYYRTTPRSDNKEWPSVLSNYRGTTMHRSYFDLSSYQENKDIARIICHLHDILLRLVFKMLEYDGTYQPTVSKKFPIRKNVDWVNKQTPASELGY